MKTKKVGTFLVVAQEIIMYPKGPGDGQISLCGVPVEICGISPSLMLAVFSGCGI